MNEFVEFVKAQRCRETMNEFVEKIGRDHKNSRRID